MSGAERARFALAAATFLTRLPLARGVALDGNDLAGGSVFFPVVGGAVGAAVGGAVYGLAQVVPSLVAAGVALTLGALLTGALHLDGLADTADALGASSRQTALAIMRDHATGAYGTAAVVLDLLVKGAALAALAPHARVVLLALAAGALSRAVPVVLGAVLPSAREDGAGAAFRVSPARAIVACAAAVALSFAAAPLDALVLCATAAALCAAFGLWYRRWLDGITGDVLGAAVELTETALLATASGLL